MKIEQIKPSELKPYFNNPRKNDDAVLKVAESIQAFGFQNPIIIDKDMTIIAGHTRWKAALKLDLKKVPVIVSQMDDKKAKAFRLADNRLGELAFWDWEKLELELDEINPDVKAWLDFQIPDFGDTDKLNIVNQENDEWVGMPEFESKDDPFKIVINFETEELRE